MARLLILISLFLSAVMITSRAFALSAAQQRKFHRLKTQCDNDGIGKACYDYARALWSTPGAIDRKQASVYFLRGCELKYKPACETHADHSTQSVTYRRHYKGLGPGETPNSCFVAEDLNKVKLTPNNISQASVHGQRLSNILAKSFWERVGFQEGDVWMKLNNLPVNTNAEVLKAFSTSGKNFAFQVERYGEAMTLWYVCN